MGCDVHPAIQIKGYSQWETILRPSSTHNYAFFGSLAGVRNDTFDPIFEPRGFPVDSGDLDVLTMFCDGDHSASWFTLAEAKRYVVGLETSSFDNDDVLDCWDNWIDDMEYCKKYLHKDDRTDDNVRVVFNFDS
jgi:hypothetical protein